MSREERAEFTNMCMITDGAGNVLVLDRQNPDWPGVTFPGGHVEPVYESLWVFQAVENIWETDY